LSELLLQAVRIKSIPINKEGTRNENDFMLRIFLNKIINGGSGGVIQRDKRIKCTN
jgi:hypothetical protein